MSRAASSTAKGKDLPPGVVARSKGGSDKKDDDEGNYSYSYDYSSEEEKKEETNKEGVGEKP